MKIMNKDFEKKLKNAIENGDVDFLQVHKGKYNINLTLADEDNDSLLDYAISNNTNNIYKFFIDEGASLNNINDYGENIVHSVVYSKCSNRLLEISEIERVEINHRSNDGTTPLLLSVLLDDFELFKTLIELGADTNIGDENNNLPIHVACQFGNLKIVDVLLNNGTNLFKKTDHGNLPLALAVNENHVDIIKKLYLIMYDNTN